MRLALFARIAGVTAAPPVALNGAGGIDSDHGKQGKAGKINSEGVF